jgi:hypothetical protein
MWYRSWRSVVMAAVAVLAIGCNRAPEPPPAVVWESALEEHEYLSSLSNPTPEQWKRRKAIAPQVEAEENHILLQRLLTRKGPAGSGAGE